MIFSRTFIWSSDLQSAQPRQGRGQHQQRRSHPLCCTCSSTSTAVLPCYPRGRVVWPASRDKLKLKTIIFLWYRLSRCWAAGCCYTIMHTRHGIYIYTSRQQHQPAPWPGSFLDTNNRMTPHTCSDLNPLPCSVARPSQGGGKPRIMINIWNQAPNYGDRNDNP